MPSALALAKRYEAQAWPALLRNANVGGENVHRGAVLGFLLGAREGVEALPADLFEGLSHRTEIAAEIDAFVLALKQ